MNVDTQGRFSQVGGDRVVKRPRPQTALTSSPASRVRAAETRPSFAPPDLKPPVGVAGQARHIDDHFPDTVRLREARRRTIRAKTVSALIIWSGAESMPGSSGHHSHGGFRNGRRAGARNSAFCELGTHVLRDSSGRGIRRHRSLCSEQVRAPPSTCQGSSRARAGTCTLGGFM